MTTQELYDLLVTRSLDGTMPGFDAPRQECFYADEEGHRCAIGVGMVGEIPDLLDLDGPVIELKRNHPALANFPKEMDLYTLAEIQDAHDTAANCIDDDSIDDDYQLDFAQDFVGRLNRLPCFASSVVQVDPTTFSASDLSSSTSCEIST